MFGSSILLITALGVAAAVATSNLPFCSRSFSEAEWQEETAAYLLNVRELQQHLQPKPQFLSKILLATGNTQSFLELVGTAVTKAVPLNEVYLSICALVLLLMLIFYFTRRKHEVGQVTLIICLIAEKPRIIKCLKIGIVLLLAVTAVYCLKGIGEGSRQEKAINHLLCRMLKTQRIFLKNNTYIKHNQMQDYVNQISYQLNSDLLKQTLNLQMKLRYAEYPQKNIETIIGVLESEAYQGSLLQQLQSANETLYFLSKFMLKAQDFDKKCKQNLVVPLFDLLKFTSISAFIQDVRSDRAKNVNLIKFPENTVIVGRIFFFAIFAIAVTACWLLLSKEEYYNQPRFYWLHSAIITTVILCFITVLLTTLLLIFNFWVYQAKQLIIRDARLCDEQQNLIRSFCRVGSLERKNTSKIPYKSLFMSNACQNYFDQFDQVVKPYFAKNDSYFSDLMASSAQVIRSEASRRGIMEKIAARNAKISLVPIMKIMHKHLAQFLRVKEEIQGQNVNIAVFFDDVTQLLANHMINNAHEIQKLCKALSITLSLVLLLSSVIRLQTDIKKNTKQIISSQSETDTELADFDIEK